MPINMVRSKICPYRNKRSKVFCHVKLKRACFTNKPIQIFFINKVTCGDTDISAGFCLKSCFFQYKFSERCCCSFTVSSCYSNKLFWCFIFIIFSVCKFKLGNSFDIKSFKILNNLTMRRNPRTCDGKI